MNRPKNKNFPGKTECAYNRGNSCAVLTEMVCVKKGKCSFFSTVDTRDNMGGQSPRAPTKALTLNKSL